MLPAGARGERGVSLRNCCKEDGEMHETTQKKGGQSPTRVVSKCSLLFCWCIFKNRTTLLVGSFPLSLLLNLGKVVIADMSLWQHRSCSIFAAPSSFVPLPERPCLRPAPPSPFPTRRLSCSRARSPTVTCGSKRSWTELSSGTARR